MLPLTFFLSLGGRDQGSTQKAGWHSSMWKISFPSKEMKQQVVKRMSAGYFNIEEQLQQLLLGLKVKVPGELRDCPVDEYNI